jgi:hypothetical protein
MKDSKGWIDKIAPEHLSSKVLSGALYIHRGKDTQEKLDRTEQVLNKLGSKLAAYSMALLVLPELIKKTQQTDEYKSSKTNYIQAQFINHVTRRANARPIP